MLWRVVSSVYPKIENHGPHSHFFSPISRISVPSADLGQLPLSRLENLHVQRPHHVVRDKIKDFAKKSKLAHTGSTFAPNAALGNGVPSLATVKASIDARRPQGCRAGAAAAPAPALPPSPASAWLRPRGAAQPGEGLHGAAGGRVCRRLVLRSPVPRGRRLRGTRSLRLRHGARSTRGTCTSIARWCTFH